MVPARRSQVFQALTKIATKELSSAGTGRRNQPHRESLVKVQIKMETIKTAREIFGRGYQIATGKKAWDEQDKR